MAAAIDTWLDETFYLGDLRDSRIPRLSSLCDSNNLRNCSRGAGSTPMRARFVFNMRDLAHTDQRGGDSRNRAHKLQGERGIFLHSERRRNEGGKFW